MIQLRSQVARRLSNVTAAGLVTLAFASGCAQSDSPDVGSEPPSSPGATPSAVDAKVSPAFEGVDPCELVPTADVAEAVGVAEIEAERSPQDSPDIIGCDWGGFGEGSASLAFMLDGDMGVDYQPIGDAGGREIKLMTGAADNCTVQVRYTNDRTMLVGVVPTKQSQPSSSGDPNRKWCDQAVALARTADSNLGWE
ncbi:DUF3558 family protein [Rhodococcus sp. HNM0569]|uniref:DUF3558 family protein n=1 Tax=Rhodococcus sp. HNM0569 TaxID=2716340 RepID=UPI00146A87D2|nr:DUF3558 family protein [Rhodococcus sp. HNM0569]NLU82614.1 DUF3558 domain-containing protein [Rhodococcus sp. HNM0569]